MKHLSPGLKLSQEGRLITYLGVEFSSHIGKDKYRQCHLSCVLSYL